MDIDYRLCTRSLQAENMTMWPHRSLIREKFLEMQLGGKGSNGE
jgi:hypothetical protein